MNFLTPSYFSRFECSASSCPDSCCRAGWLIPIDSETYGFYGKCGIDIEKNTFSEDGDRVFRLNADGSCVYLNGDGLCELFIKETHNPYTDLVQKSSYSGGKNSEFSDAVLFFTI